MLPPASARFLLVEIALDDVGHVVVLAKLGGVLDQVLVLLRAVLGLDGGIFLEVNILVEIFNLDIALHVLRLVADRLLDGGCSTDRCADTARTAQRLDVEDGAAGWTDDGGTAEIVEAGATALAHPLG